MTLAKVKVQPLQGRAVVPTATPCESCSHRAFSVRPAPLTIRAPSFAGRARPAGCRSVSPPGFSPGRQQCPFFNEFLTKLPDCCGILLVFSAGTDAIALEALTIGQFCRFPKDVARCPRQRGERFAGAETNRFLTIEPIGRSLTDFSQSDTCD